MTESIGPFMDHAENMEPDFDALAAFADGRLSADEHARASEHLASCARCRTIVAELVRSRSAARYSTWLRALPIAASVALAVAAGLYWTAGSVSLDRPTPVPAPPPSVPSPPTNAPPAVASPTPPPPNRQPVESPPDRTRAAGLRPIGTREFRLEAGEWIDVRYRVADFLPSIDVQSQEELAKYPQLAAFRELLPRFTVVVDGTVYRVSVASGNP